MTVVLWPSKTLRYSSLGCFTDAVSASATGYTGLRPGSGSMWSAAISSR
jgi:hypothetical protein